MSGRLHQNVPTWCDTCSCEPEPRWEAVAAELSRAAESESAGETRPEGEATRAKTVSVGASLTRQP